MGAVDGRGLSCIRGTSTVVSHPCDVLIFRLLTLLVVVQLFTDEYFPLGMEASDDDDHYLTWGEWKGRAWKSPDTVKKLTFMS